MGDERGALVERRLISGREAARELAEIGLTRRQSCRILNAGLAGAPVVTRAALLYDADRVAELAARPALTDEAADASTPGGLFVARRDVDVLAPEGHQRQSLRGGWDFSLASAVSLRLLVSDHGRVPLVATVGGFVAVGAEIVAVRGPSDGYQLELRECGPWFSTFRGRRFTTGPGRPWVLRDRLRVGQSAA